MTFIKSFVMTKDVTRKKRFTFRPAVFFMIFSAVMLLLIFSAMPGGIPLAAGFGNYNDYSYSSGGGGGGSSSSWGGGSSWGGSSYGGGSYGRSSSRYTNPQWGDGKIHSAPNLSSFFGDSISEEMRSRMSSRNYYIYTRNGQMEMGSYEELSRRLKENPTRYSNAAYQSEMQSRFFEENGGFILMMVICFLASIVKVMYTEEMNKTSAPTSSSRSSTSASGSSGTRKISLHPEYVTKHDVYYDKRTFIDRGTEIEKVIAQNDPDFSMMSFIAYVRNVYMEIQNAWMERDLKPVRHLLDENLYDQTEKQVQQFIDDGIINALKGISILNIHATSYRTDAQNEILTTYLCAKMRDYQYEEKSKRIIRGNMTTYWEMAYRMRFVRIRGSKTAKDGAVKAYNCPNCAAPLRPGISETCPHCNSYVSSIKSEWLLHDFEATNSSMKDEGVEKAGE